MNKHSLPVRASVSLCCFCFRLYRSGTSTLSLLLSSYSRGCAWVSPRAGIPRMQIRRLSYRPIVSLRVERETTERSANKVGLRFYPLLSSSSSSSPSLLDRCTCTTTRGCMMYIRHRDAVANMQTSVVLLVACTRRGQPPVMTVVHTPLRHTTLPPSYYT